MFDNVFFAIRTRLGVLEVAFAIHSNDNEGARSQVSPWKTIEKFLNDINFRMYRSKRRWVTVTNRDVARGRDYFFPQEDYGAMLGTHDALGTLVHTSVHTDIH